MSPPFPVPFAIGDLLDILPDAVVMVDGRGDIVYANPAVRGLLGYLQDEIVGQALSVLVPASVRERHEALVGNFRQGGSPKMMGSPSAALLRTVIWRVACCR